MSPNKHARIVEMEFIDCHFAAPHSNRLPVFGIFDTFLIVMRFLGFIELLMWMHTVDSCNHLPIEWKETAGRCVCVCVARLSAK